MTSFFYNCKFVHFDPSLIPLPPFTGLWQPANCSLHLWALWFCFVFLYVCDLNTTYKWNHKVVLFLWFISFSKHPWGPFTFSTNDKISFLCMDICYFKINRWTYFDLKMKMPFLLKWSTENYNGCAGCVTLFSLTTAKWIIHSEISF